MDANVDLKKSWIIIKHTFPILDNNFNWPYAQTTDAQLFETINLINRFGLNATIKSLIISKFEEHVRKFVVPKFWAFFTTDINVGEGFGNFFKAVDYLYTFFTNHIHLIGNTSLLCNSKPIYNAENATDSLKLIIRATLLSQLPLNYNKIIEEFYETALKLENNDDTACPVCGNEPECSCLIYFHATNSKLVELKLLEPLCGQVLTSLIYGYIESYINKTCKDNFDNSYIDALEKWLDQFIINWLRKVYGCDGSSELQEQEYKQKLTNLLYETYTKVRINQLFNIIIEYPESSPALEDLSKCLPKTDLRPLLTKKLQKAMETRLLHPGVSTPDILTAYVASIRSMRILDPSGLLLDVVTQPMHEYLRSREDTVRCVVSSLTEEGPNDLAEELVKGDAVHVDETAASDEDTENWEAWMPDPVDVDPSKTSNIRRSADIISMLVSVYGSKELFINEYRTLLADRLLSQFSCDTEKEIRYLELLKLRFGDSQLHYCEVMLKDISDSKRINHHIKQDANYTDNSFPISALIVSAQFWPPFKDEQLELHPKVLSQMETFTKSFEALKGNRTLSWKNHLGVVDLEIELKDRVLNLSVTPVHAAILMRFQDQDDWCLDRLSRTLHIPPIILRKKIRFWLSHGLIDEFMKDCFCLVEEHDTNVPNLNADVVLDDYESESVMASTQDQREEELQTFWSYIIGMLMNLDSLPLERIHQMLKMFAFQGPTIECSLQELTQFLDRKVREQKLVFSGGLYKLPKNDML